MLTRFGWATGKQERARVFKRVTGVSRHYRPVLAKLWFGRRGKVNLNSMDGRSPVRLTRSAFVETPYDQDKTGTSFRR